VAVAVFLAAVQLKTAVLVAVVPTILLVEQVLLVATMVAQDHKPQAVYQQAVAVGKGLQDLVARAVLVARADQVEYQGHQVSPENRGIRDLVVRADLPALQVQLQDLVVRADQVVLVDRQVTFLGQVDQAVLKDLVDQVAQIVLL
jgi:hypothetical protein